MSLVKQNLSRVGRTQVQLRCGRSRRSAGRVHGFGARSVDGLVYKRKLRNYEAKCDNC